jgi:hypothetical protein
LNPEEVEVVIRRVDEAEIDEMWSFVGKKKEQRWLWHAVDHRSGKVLAYVLGARKDEVFPQLKALLKPFGYPRNPLILDPKWGPLSYFTNELIIVLMLKWMFAFCCTYNTII